LEALDAGLRRARGDVRERGPRRGLDDRAVDRRLPPRVLQDDSTDALVGDEQVRPTAEYEDPELVLTRDADGADEVGLGRDAHEEVGRTADVQRRMRREPLATDPEWRDGHAGARTRRRSRRRSPAGRMSPAPR